MSTRFYRNPMGRDFAGGLPCQAPSEGTPQSAARGAPQSGDRAAAGMSRPRQEPVGRLHPAAGSHLPSEETAPPLAVRPGAQPEGPREAGIGQRRGCQTAPRTVRALTARYGVASSFGRNCSALRGLIRVVAFRASHPAKPPSRQRRLVQGFLKREYLTQSPCRRQRHHPVAPPLFSSQRF
jgi:hypothetical protein